MTETSKPSSGRFVKILLIVSLGVNLAIAGMAIGIWLTDRPNSRPQSPDAVAFLSFALPPEHRNALREQLVSRRDELRNNRNAIANMRRDMINALQADPFEMEDIEAILQRQRDRFLNLGELAHSALVERIEMLTPEERKIYINSLKNRERRPRP